MKNRLILRRDFIKKSNFQTLNNSRSVPKLSHLSKALLPAILLVGQLGFAQTNTKTAPPVPEVRTIQPGDKRIFAPQAPEGYHLLFKGSDRSPIIDSTGAIVTPLVESKVNLYFQLISNQIDTLKYDVSKQVTVPGKFADKGSNPQPFVIPALREWHGGVGNYALTASSRIVVNMVNKTALQKVASILKREIKEQTGLSLAIISGKPENGDIFLTLQEPDKSIGEEGYYFKVDQYVTISALRYQGLFWGTRTLLQLLEHQTSIPKGIARDYPEFKVRGFVLDDGRKFFSLQFLRDYVKLMSYYKLNDFQIHLNDNGFKKYFNNSWDSTYSAFRLENTTYPGLTAKDGSYTKKEFIDLQQLADDYAVRIIPEIDVPAHALAFTKVVPAIGSKQYGMDHLDLHNPLTYTVIENVLKEYLGGDHPVFTGKEFHIGTDEYAKQEAEAFRAFTDHFIKYVQGFGKDVRVWGALTHAKGTTPVTVKNVTMNTWYNGYANPVDMKKLGYRQISTPDGWLYIVPAAGYYFDYLDCKNIYDNWTPSMIGDVRFPAGDPTIIGGSFAAWNDIVGNGISEKDVNDRVFPAMQVLSQKMWDGNHTENDYAGFATASKQIGEGPAVNIRGRISADTTFTTRFTFNKPDPKVQLHGATYTQGIKGQALAFLGDKSWATLPYPEIGYNYTISFWINPAGNPSGDVTLFKGPNSVVKLKQGNTGKLGFSRDGYNLDFDYTLPENVWTHVVISGTNKGTSLYINGQLQKKLYDNWIQFTDKEKTKMRKVETLFFPLQQIGGFHGKIDDLQIWNRVLSDQEIANDK
ncbi:family 20 glycosylhydrolase [Mucilaginibacter sp. SG564]|uniref:family 20 glycosylhydrolase n=1 Tax=Mucilaginibacter sp. SG564 TaxID=2587022 RepID=UPI001552B578|nr:family 20 glycosylhydrolase [Mucilaginibacter sp. SG564]NOW95612.1 hexosaminidase [Mucilaginibacter sp. SG564]